VSATSAECLQLVALLRYSAAAVRNRQRQALGPMSQSETGEGKHWVPYRIIIHQHHHHLLRRAAPCRNVRPIQIIDPCSSFLLFFLALHSCCGRLG
jgi:hypothetical protein